MGGVHAFLQLAVEARDVQADRRSVVSQLGVAQLVLVGKEAVVHLPEAILCAGGLRGLRGGRSPGVQTGQRHVAEDEAKLIAEVREQLVYHRVGLATVGALEIAVFDERDARFRCAAHVVTPGIHRRTEGCGNGRHRYDLSRGAPGIETGVHLSVLTTHMVGKAER